MAGILDYITSPQMGILSLPDGSFPPVDDAAAAQAAREAAARRSRKPDFAQAADDLLRQTEQPSVPLSQGVAPDASAPGISYALDPSSAAPFGSLAPVARPAVASFADQVKAMPDRTFEPAVPFPSAVPMPQPRPAGPIAVGDYQMPRAGSASLYQPKAGDTQQAELPANATPTQGEGAPVNAPVVPETSLLGRVGKLLQGVDNVVAPRTATLLALAGGLAGAPSWGTGISRGLTAAAAALPVDQKLGMQNLGIAQTFKALREAGVPPQLALASVYNPEILKSTVQSYLADRKGELKEIGTDLAGNKRYGVFDPITRTITPVGSKGSVGAAAGGESIPGLAPGVTEENLSLTGPEYLAQYSPDLQAMAKAFINGDVMPTGNPRLQGLQTKAKQIAIKYGQDMGIPVSDTTYAEKRKLKTDLGSSGNSSLGGILSNGESSFAHLAEASESMADLGNASHNFVGGGPLAHSQNYVTNALVPSSQTASKIKALNNNLGRYGQESTKFYAGSGGGVEERTAARKEMNAETTSSEEYAGYLEKEKSLMMDRLEGKFAQMRQVLGEEEANREIAKHMPDIQKNLSRIDASIARLRGGVPSNEGKPSAPAQLPAGWSVQVH